MGFGLGGKKSSNQQQNPYMVQETVLPIKAKLSLEHQDRLKAKSCMSKPYGDLSRELIQHANARTLVQPKTSGNCQKLPIMVRTKKDDELVKYMSNLPCYLQRVERTENVQDKALNVGVLDWTRLESWKCDQKGTPSCNLSSKKMTRSSTLHSPAHNEIFACRSKQHPSLSCRKNSSNNDGISGAKSSIQDAMLIQDVQNASKSHFDRQKRASWNYKSFDRKSSVIISEKGRRRELDHRITSKLENQSSNSGYNEMPIESKESLSYCDRESKQRVEDMQGSDVKRKDLKQKSTSSIRASSSKLGNYDISLGAKEKKNVDKSETRKRIELQESAISLPSDGRKNIVLLIPRKQNSFLMQQRTSFDETLAEANQNTSSNGFSDKEVHSPELHYEIPHSCPLPSTAEINTEKQQMASDATRFQDAELSTDAIDTLNFSSRNLFETSKTLDQDTTELAATKGRHPSPNRRFSFSFSLGRMTRSFSFKESSAVPQLSSTYASVKSGPVISRASADLDNSNREKGGGPNRARSSPLRRILDPLLKSKSVAPSQSAETDMLLRGSLNSYSFKPNVTTESFQNEKHELSSIQAQLMLTTRNGLPLFRFVINKNNIIVAATVKNLASSGKTDPGCCYALYSIDEIKRKSGSWINQGSKEKGCGFVYNVVGQMKLNNSYMDLSEQKSNSQCMIKESVLFGVEPRQTGQASQRLMPNTELAAVVVKMPSENLGFGRQENDKEEDIMQKGVSWCLPENEDTNRCTVILPGGIHSLPKIGVPSSLIHRWRYNGSCDCGGWDVGCKLRILSSDNKHQKLPWMSNACWTSNCFELFAQGESQQDKPIFSMAPIGKEKYSVEFNPSISLLQAFFISITAISCQKLSNFTEENNVFEEEILQESDTANVGMKKIRSTVLAEAPMKYTPSPPVSPVGRV